MGTRCEVSGKVMYGHKKAAMGAAAAVRKHVGEDVQGYKCKHCREWHIGHRVARHVRLGLV